MIIKDRMTDDLLTIDPTAKSARSTLYQENGITPFENGARAYSFVWSINNLGRYTAIMPAFATIAALRNGTEKNLLISKICATVAFDGTPAASTQVFRFKKYFNGTPTGGISLSPLTVTRLDRSFYQGSLIYSPQSLTTLLGVFVADITTTTGLGMAAPQQSTEFIQFILPRNAGVIKTYEWLFSDTVEDRIWLHPGEGLALSQLADAVVGDSITVKIFWDEVPV